MSYFNSISQNSIVDPSNSSTANLASGATFTGTAVAIINYNAIQVVLLATVASGTCSATVYVDQSTDGVNWDVTDSYVYTGSQNFGITVASVATFYRVRVTNTSLAATVTLRLGALLCPIADPLPRSLGHKGNLQTAINRLQDQYNFTGHFSPSHAMQVAQPYRLIGTTFGASNDANFWTPTVSGAGATATVATGEALVVSGTANGGYAKFTTTHAARFIIDNAHKFRGIMRLPTVAVANTKRGWGAVTFSAGVTPANGPFFSVDAAGVLSVNTCAGGVITSVASGSFNGDVSQFLLDTNEHIYDIFYTIAGTWFVIDSVLIHTVSATISPLSQVIDLPINFWSANTAVSTGASVECWGSAVSRLGRDHEYPTSAYSTGPATTTLKTGSGAIQSICISSTANNSTVTVYDNTAASGTILYGFNSSLTNQSFQCSFGTGLPFYTGLTIVTVGAGLQVTIVYE